MKPETEIEILQILDNVAECAIQLTWKSDNPLPGVGERRSTSRGAGTEYMEFDLFQDGDDFRDINWQLSAADADDELWKTVYQEEKDVPCYILTKVGHTMDFGTVRTTKRQLAAELAASVLFSLSKTSDKAGLISFTKDHVVGDEDLRSATNNLYPILVNILEADPKPNAASGDPKDGLAKALSGLPGNRRCLVFVMSDFIDMTPADWEALANAGVAHDVITFYVQDKRERELPKPKSWWGRFGYFYNLEGPDGSRRLIWNSVATRKQWADNFAAFEAATLAKLSDCMCESLVVSTDMGQAHIPLVLNLFSNRV